MPVRQANRTLFASAVRAATVASTALANHYHSSLLVILNITDASGTGGLTLKIRGYDPTSAQTIDMLVDGTPIVATGTFGFLLSTNAGTAADGVRVTAPFDLPSKWDVQVAHGDGSNYTYSVSAVLIP